jgi:hypothetical protein
LLDWLACELVDHGWDMKAIHKEIAMSATYRQCSSISRDLVERDPHNRLLARGPRVRLEAEMIRDQALAVSGLLSRKLGGPSVMPPQPEGVWSNPYSGEKWSLSNGDDRYRRGVYTFWRRTAPYPSFMSFDAPSREFCVVRRPRTNTPLQALTVLNDPVYVEAAQSLARKIASAPEKDIEEQVEYGFRMPSALDNRPLTFEEFEHRTNQIVYVSATPGPYELTKSAGVVVEQIIRPTGLVDPPVEIRPVKGQIDDLLHEIRERVKKGERVLVTTLTKRMSEDLAEYYSEVGVKCRYMHSEIETLERVKILRDLRKGEFDVLIGINLLREGLDLPEVSLVAILDADKEGFLRSSGSLIQTIGRCARNLNGRAVLYADRMTDSMTKAMNETDRRRAIQEAYNVENGITPESIVRPLDMSLVHVIEADYADFASTEAEGIPEFTSQEELDAFIAKMETEMRETAKRFEFEKAAKLRDKIKELRTKEFLFA